jgi:hypothetical protein
MEKVAEPFVAVGKVLLGTVPVAYPLVQVPLPLMVRAVPLSKSTKVNRWPSPGDPLPVAEVGLAIVIVPVIGDALFPILQVSTVEALPDGV